MKVVLKFEYDADVIDVPDFIGNDINDYQEKFDEWLYDESNDHPFWLYSKGKKDCVSFRADAFIYWLNGCILVDSREKARIYDSFAKKYDKKHPTIYF